MINKNSLLDKLDEIKITHTLHRHKPLHTVEDSIQNRGQIDGAHSKNLFLKNKKRQFFLFSCVEDTKIELKKLSKSLGLGNISFAKEDDLYNLLGVLPGSVTPFGLLNDVGCKVTFYLDSKFLLYKTVNFHPLTNGETLNLSLNNFLIFLAKNNKKVNVFDFNNYSLI
jgi:Ala-tRNA(Pro) deacylase